MNPVERVRPILDNLLKVVERSGHPSAMSHLLAQASIDDLGITTEEGLIRPTDLRLHYGLSRETSARDVLLVHYLSEVAQEVVA